MVTQADIDALNEQIASGVRQVVIGDQSITTNTTTSLIQARDDLVRQLAKQKHRRPTQVLIRYSGRGY